MPSRRHFLGKLAQTSLIPSFLSSSLLKGSPLTSPPPSLPPDELARDESYWYAIQQAFSVDRSLIHLNTGGVCPTPLCVQQAAYEHQKYAYKVPFYVHRRALQPQWERVRKGIADTFGCDMEEIAITRNTSEGMEICQLGLEFEPGDEILTTDQDYPRMLNTWKQRAQREGIVLKQCSLPVPAEDTGHILDLFDTHITPRTRLIMICHMIDLTGQIMPVQDIVALAHAKGIPVLVDGAQAFGHIDIDYAGLACDFYATSLHKWTMGPPGTGFLFVRKRWIESVWPLMPSDAELQQDIRKFEDAGTQSLSRFLAVSEALIFHHTIGAANKEARLRYLRHYWQQHILGLDRIRLHTSQNPHYAAGLATFQIEGIDSVALRDYLWNTHRIIVRPITHPSVEGIRVSAGLHTTPGELDQFVEVIKQVVNHGIT